MSTCFLGIDLGGSSVKAAVLDQNGNILARRTLDFQPAQERNWAETVGRLVREIREELAGSTLHVALSAPGLASSNGRSIAYMPGRLEGLEGLDWTDYLEAPHEVPVLNDAHAALLGERWIGAAMGLRNVVMLTLGTGVGGAAIVDGQLLRGQIGRAGHLGHICLDPDGPPGITRIPGSLEYMIGNYSVHERSAGLFNSTHDLVVAHLEGNHHATQVWLRSIKALACGIASLVNVLDPEAVIIGGGIASAKEALFSPVREYLDEIEWRPGGHQVRLVPAKLGEFAGAIGAASRLCPKGANAGSTA